MSISRRQFFRGLTPQGKDPQLDYRRKARDVENYVRTNLLPYDFALTEEQKAEVLRAAIEGMDISPNQNVLDDDRLRRIREIVEQRVQGWREEYLKAEDARQRALILVRQFVSLAAPEDLSRMRQRLGLQSPISSLYKEIERAMRVWLSSLPNNRLAICEEPDLRELVFSELRSWC